MITQTRLANTLNPELILIQADISSHKRLLEEMAKLLSQTINHEECEERDIYHLLLEREKLGNTGIGSGVAIPHSRCAFIDEAIIGVITMQTPIDYHSPDRQPVDIAFGLLVPENANQAHLDLLANIARLTSNLDHKQQITQADSPEELINLVDQYSQQQDD